MIKLDVDKRPIPDPERWSDRARGGCAIEDVVGAALGRVRDATAAGEPAWASRSSHAAAEPTSPRFAWPARRWRPAVVAAVIILGTGGVVAAARLALAPPRRSQQTVLVPAAAAVVVQGPRRRRLTIAGPARLEIEPGARGRADLAVAGGLLTVEAGDAPLSVEAEVGLVSIPSGAAGEIDGRAGAAPAVRALAGELRVTAPGGRETTVRLLAAAPPTLRARAVDATPASPVAAAPATAPVDLRVAQRPAPHRRALASRANPPAPPPPAFIAPPPYPSPALTPAPPAAADAHAGEGEVLVRAFQGLRAKHDAAAALVALDEYQRRFPEGTLRAEAKLARAEALLMLGRSSDALSLLMARDGESGGAPSILTRDVRAVRGELLAAGGRCSEALADFEQLLASSPAMPDAAGARALYGRASCRLQAGDRAGARRDLQSYLSRYPNGDLVAAVRRALDALDAR